MWQNLILPLLFWSGVVLLSYTFLGYPILIYVLGRLFPKKITERDSGFPAITIVLAAFNEDQRIVARLRNLLETNYPKDKLSIVLVSDASTDSTVDKAN